MLCCFVALYIEMCSINYNKYFPKYSNRSLQLAMRKHLLQFLLLFTCRQSWWFALVFSSVQFSSVQFSTTKPAQ